MWSILRRHVGSLHVGADTTSSASVSAYELAPIGAYDSAGVRKRSARVSISSVCGPQQGDKAGVRIHNVVHGKRVIICF